MGMESLLPSSRPSVLLPVFYRLHTRTLYKIPHFAEETAELTIQ